MTVPGVSLICAATVLAAIGEPSRCLASRRLVVYLGLDPKVRQSGEARRARPGSLSARRLWRGGRWSKRRLVSSSSPGAARVTKRTRARRGHGKASVATARKLAVLFWCKLCRDEDYAHQRLALTKKKLRQRERTAGAPARTKAAAGIWSTNRAILHAERELALQAEASYQPVVTDQQAGRPSRKVGASATPERP